MRNPLKFTRLHPAAEITSADVARFIARLATPDSPRPLAFETWATKQDVTHFVGRDGADATAVRMLLQTQLPGALLERSPRPSAPTTSMRLLVRLASMPLAEANLANTLHSIYGAFKLVRGDESLAVQIVVGAGHRPARTPSKVPDPAQSFLGSIIAGPQQAGAETQRRIAKHRAEPRLSVTIRLGVTATAAPRRRELLTALLGAVKQLESPGSRVDFVREAPSRWHHAGMGWAPLEVTPAQLTPLFCWPVDGLILPGLPGPHPKLLSPPTGLPKDGAEFAITSAPGPQLPVKLAPTARLQHLVVSGGTGSGKSTVLARLCLDDIANHRPALLIDPKRQLVDDIIRRAPKEAAGTIVVIDAAEPDPVGFNPLDLGDRDADVVVDGILAVLKNVFAEGWGPRTEDLMHAGLLTLARVGKEKGTPHTLLDLPRIISDAAFRRGLVGYVADDPVLAEFWATFDALSPAHRASIVAAPMNKLRKYMLRKNVTAVLGQSEPRFRLRDIFKEQKVVLVPLNDALLGPGAAQLLGGLIVAEAWLATLERAGEANPTERPGAIYIDEVQRFLHLPTSVEDALATSRSYGVAWHLALQGRSQISKQFALALELNARNKLTFAASPNDARELARSSRHLSAEDFQALKPFELYADLVVDGAPAGWFSARSLPPLPLGTSEQLIRASNTEHFGRRQSPATPSGPEPTPSAPVLGNQRKRRS